MDRLVSGYQCKSPIGRGALAVQRLGLGAAAMVEERWRLGFGEREGDGAGREAAGAGEGRERGVGGSNRSSIT